MANVGQLSIKIFCLDYYFSIPINSIDSSYSPLFGQEADKVPVIRIFGTTPEGQKICANVHGVLPYFFLSLPTLEEDNGLEDFIRSLTFNLDKLLRKNSTSHLLNLTVFDASIVSGRSIYGYHDSEQAYLKLYILDPALVPRCAEVLLSGSVLSRTFQPYETHIPYLLQFCTDYNLFGMNYLHTAYFKFRTSGLSETFSSSEGLNHQLWSLKNVNPDHILSPHLAPKWSSTELEVDISACDILNRNEIRDGDTLNPGLEAMWNEELSRRINLKNLPRMPTAEELLPSTRNIELEKSTSEIYFLNQWNDLLSSYTITTNKESEIVCTPKEISDPTDFITEWLESSQPDQYLPSSVDSDNNNNDNDNNNKNNNLLLLSSSKTASKSSGFTSVSLNCLEELSRLASITEELDSWLPDINESNESQRMQWLWHKTKTESNNLNNNYLTEKSISKTITNSMNMDEQKQCMTENIPTNNELSLTEYSQDLLESQSSLCLAIPSFMEQSKSIISNNNDDDGDHDDDDDVNEQTLLSNATQCALSFICGDLNVNNIDMASFINNTNNLSLSKNNENLIVNTNTTNNDNNLSDEYLMSQTIKSQFEVNDDDDGDNFEEIINNLSYPLEFWDSDDFSDSITQKIQSQSVEPNYGLEVIKESENELDQSVELSFSLDLDKWNSNNNEEQIQPNCSSVIDLSNCNKFLNQPCTSTQLDTQTKSTEVESLSDLLMDSDWDNQSTINSPKTENYLPQLDGLFDDIEESEDFIQNLVRNPTENNTQLIDLTRKRRARRTLGLRLSTNRSLNLPVAINSTQINNSNFPQQQQEINLSTTNNLDLPISSIQSDATEKSISLNISTNENQVNCFHNDPIVLVERLSTPLISKENECSTNTQESGRLTPPDEFEDIEMKQSTPEDNDNNNLNVTSNLFELSSLQLNLSKTNQSFDPSTTTLGHLTLYSQSQLSSLSPIQNQSFRSTFQLTDRCRLPTWCPSIEPPCRQIVDEWFHSKLMTTNVTKKNNANNNNNNKLECKTLLKNEIQNKCIDSSQSSSSSSSINDLIENSMNKTQMGKLEIDQNQSNHSLCLISSSKLCNEEDNVNSIENIHNKSISNEHLSSSSSISLLYQANSQRCYLPVQVDHTTVASLELHCRSRFTSMRSISLSQSIKLNQNQNSNNSNSINHSNFGLIPTPSIDPICFTCLTIIKPEKQIKSQYIFVLINQSEINGINYEEIKNLPCKFFHSLTNYNGLNNSKLGNNLKKNKLKKIHTQSIIPKFIWCSTEWILLNWIVYFIHCFDPEILIGYDVERFSWGYLVDRANQLGRQSYPRELSRLSPDVINCPHCRMCIKECKSLAELSIHHPYHFDTYEFVQKINTNCECVCSPMFVSNNKVKKFERYPAWPCGPGAGRTGAKFACPGRVVLCFWRTLMHEVSLFEYSVESVVNHLLKEPMPRFTYGQLTQWFNDPTGLSRWRTVDYYIHRSLINLRLLTTLDLIGRTSEFARVFGIEFYHVMSRGSQYRVESLLCRMAKQANYLLPSPSVTQRAHQRAPEAIPLNLEPESILFINGPVAVLDFQSLYPSIMIAYNYCYSTILGRLNCLIQGEQTVFDLGCLSHYLPAGLIKKIGKEVTISPNGVVFVNKSIREGVLPRMLKQLLTTRLMVKDSMKLHKSDRCLDRLLDARQLGLKLMANVTFGYTAASFSGRMPCVDLGDSIVHKARETLENAIQFVNNTKSFKLPANCIGLPHPRVVYGDTDSLFIYFEGYGKVEAFQLAEIIAQSITNLNPAPIKLKVEKIYYPCLLEAKKRYVGYAYENVNQTEPKLDAKGIETVRRDSCPFVGRTLENLFKLLFDQFPFPNTVVNGVENSSNYLNSSELLKLAEYRIRESVREFATNLILGKVPFNECLLARPFWGQLAYKPGAFAPALQVARRLLSIDPHAEPLPGERVVYFIAPGRSNQTLISCVHSVNELEPYVISNNSSSSSNQSRRSLSPRLNLAYYLDKQLIPPVERMTQLIGWRVRNWLNDLPRFLTSRRNRIYTINLLNQTKNTFSSHLSSNQKLSTLGSPQSSFILSPQTTSDTTSNYHPKKHKRQSDIMNRFLGLPPRVCPNCDSIIPNLSSTDQWGNCYSCLQHNPTLATISSIRMGCELNRSFYQMNLMENLCNLCLSNQNGHSAIDSIWLCTNLFCPIHSQRLLATHNLTNLWNRYAYQLNQIDNLNSW